MSGDVPSVERRSVPRNAPWTECRAEISGPAGRIRGTLRDVSTLGASIDADRELPASAAGSAVRVSLSWAGRIVEVAARVHGLRGAAIGVEFDEPVDPADLPVLVDMDLVRVDPVWALRVPAAFAMRRGVLAFASVSSTVLVACEGDPDEAALRAVERHVGAPVRAQPAEPLSLRRAMSRVYAGPAGAADTSDPVEVCSEILRAAWLRHASDVHLDPDDAAVRVRLRVDGRLEDYRRLPLGLHAELLGRIKVLANMDVAERRSPQDGRFTQDFGDGGPVDVRVATLPTRYGERVSLRLLATRAEILTLESLGLSARDLGVIARSMRRTHGLVLAAGPTGCGKSTTLYAGLREVIASRPVNAITVQDPVEYDIAGAAQVEVDTAQKVTFARALRSILRHDPDVIMVGEIRDAETVDIAIKAALTGHLVLATLHTNSAASAVTRLRDMGVEPYLIAATLRLVVAQRLARRLCPWCRRRTVLTGAQAAALGRPGAAGTPAFAPHGCLYCAGGGHSGRVGLFELLECSSAWSAELLADAREAQLEERMRREGVPSMADDALEKVAAGLVSADDAVAAVAG